ncbi:hypothetical protein HZ326_12804 [Fusarium oxysporum f. sp. albedinis]|nr:hypothetical protein HZ326_12804 [Fusarium oxysporum f. sp. albedinis]
MKRILMFLYFSLQKNQRTDADVSHVNLRLEFTVPLPSSSNFILTERATMKRNEIEMSQAQFQRHHRNRSPEQESIGIALDIAFDCTKKTLINCTGVCVYGLLICCAGSTRGYTNIFTSPRLKPHSTKACTYDQNLSSTSLVPLTPSSLSSVTHYDIVNPRLRAASYCWVAREGRIDILKKAHENGANLSGTGTMSPEERATPLHYAIKQGHRDIVEYLAEIGVDPHVPARGVCDCWSDIEPVRPYALHMAIRHSGFEGAEKILVQKLGAYWTFQGTSALDHWNEPELVNRLLERSDMDASVPDSDGQTPLFWAIQYKRVDIVTLLLKRQEVNPGTPDRNGFTPLQVAVGVRSLPLVGLLLQCEETNARRTDAGKSSALHIAAARGELQIVNLLLEQNGLEVASPDSTGNTPLHWAVRSRDKKYHPSLVTIYDDDENNDDDEDEDDDSDTFDEPPGYREESLDIIKRLLARQEVNAGGHDQDGPTPLHHACLIAYYEVVALLLQRQDADPKARGITGQTPLHLAASNHQLSAKRIMNLLLEQPGVEITEVDHDGRTVLHYLCGGYEKSSQSSI